MTTLDSAPVRARPRDSRLPDTSGCATGDDWIGLSPDPLDLGTATRWASIASCGAVVAFEGIVREHSHDGDGVTAIDYEVHSRYAVNRMAQIAAAARRQWPELGRIAVWHRIGLVPLTESSVVIAVSAPHRISAFDAARFCIDLVKQCVPVWKHEHRGVDAQPMLDGADITDVTAAARAWLAREQAR